jgi:hypothetical protein
VQGVRVKRKKSILPVNGILQLSLADTAVERTSGAFGQLQTFHTLKLQARSAIRTT